MVPTNDHKSYGFLKKYTQMIVATVSVYQITLLTVHIFNIF